MPAVLGATGPHPDHADKLHLYGQLVGTWDVENRYLDPSDGNWYTGTVVWTFGWILDGHGVQDVMRFRFPDGSTPTGTTVRLLNQKTGEWQVVWFPQSGQLCTLVGRRSPEGILQEGTQLDGASIRWSFTEMTADSFRWQGYIRRDRDATWELEQEMHAKRRR
jgi:hypothetical protein